MKTAAAYIRVSTDGQLEYSPDSQLKVIRDYAQKNGLLLPESYIFREEEGISGKQAEKRPAFMRMIGTAKQKPKPFDCIILWKFSRFARSRRDSIVYKTMLRKQLGIDVVSVTEQLGDDKLSILMEAVIEAMDEYYSINLAEEVKRGMLEKVSRGEPVTPPAFGYIIREKRYIPDQDAAQAVQMMFQLCAQGISCGEIAQRLNALGIRTTRGQLWEARAVEYLLRNPVYAGKIRWNPHGAAGRRGTPEASLLTEGTHQAIIAPVLWEKVQDQLGAKGCKRRTVSDKSIYLLRGLVYCSNCGAPLVKTSRDALQCRAYAHKRCDVSHYISMQKIEKMVLCTLESDLQMHIVHLKRSAAQPYPELLREQVEREQKKLERLREAYESGAETLEEYQVEKARLQARISEQSKNLATLSEHTPPCPKTADLFELLRGNMLPAEAKNRLLHAFVDRIVFDPAHSHLSIHYRMM